MGMFIVPFNQFSDSRTVMRMTVFVGQEIIENKQ